MNDEQIEALFKRCGGRWTGDFWEIEDADLHPMIRAAIATSNVLELSMNALTTPSLPLQWQPVPQSLPPDPDGNWFSPMVWLALSDGRVVQGQCLHRCKDAQYDAPVHAWFEGQRQLPDSIKVVAWMPFATPDFPTVFLTQPEQAAMRRALRRSVRVLA